MAGTGMLSCLAGWWNVSWRDKDKETPYEDRLRLTETIILLDSSGSIVKAQRFQLHVPENAFKGSNRMLYGSSNAAPPFLSDRDNEPRLLPTKLIRLAASSLILEDASKSSVATDCSDFTPFFPASCRYLLPRATAVRQVKHAGRRGLFRVFNG